VGVDTAAIPGFINTLRGLPADPSLASAAATAPAAVTADVLNATTIAGLAGRNADALRSAGFHVDTVDSTDPAAKTAIEYPTGMQGQAKAVAKVVPGAQLVMTSSVKKVTLVLGADGLQVTGTSSSQSTANAPASIAPSTPATSAKTSAADKAATPPPASCIN